MNTYNFSKIGAKWEKNDQDRLIQMYNDENKNVVEIAQELCRTPSGIAERLSKLKIVNSRKECRGYADYLYRPEYRDYRSSVTSEKKRLRMKRNEKNKESSNEIMEEILKIKVKIDSIEQKLEKMRLDINNLTKTIINNQ